MSANVYYFIPVDQGCEKESIKYLKYCLCLIWAKKYEQKIKTYILISKFT